MLLAFALGGLDASASSPDVSPGLQHLADERFEEARRFFLEASRSAPDSAAIYYYLGIAESGLGRGRESIAAYLEAEQRDPTLPGLQTRLGIAYYAADDSSAAERHLRRALSQDPEDASAHLFLGLALQKQGRWAESIGPLEAAHRWDPSLAALAWLHIGRAHLRLGSEEEARTALKLAKLLDREGDVREDAQALLASLEEPARGPRLWELEGGAGLEYDDALVVPEADLVNEEDDVAGFFDFSARVLPRWREIDFEVGYSFYQSAYADLEDLDLHIHSPVVAASTDVHGFTPFTRYRYTHMRLGGGRFLDLHTGSLGVERLIAPWGYAIVGWDIEGRDFAGRSERDGIRNALVVDFFLFDRSRRFSGTVGWRLEGQDVDARELDFLGNVLRVEARTPTGIPGVESRLLLGYELLDRRYAGETPSIGRKRRDRWHTLRVGVRADVTPHVAVAIEYRYTDADSNLPSQRFTQNVVSLRASVALSD